MVSIIVVGARIKFTLTSHAFAHLWTQAEAEVICGGWTETIPLSSLDVYKRPRILEGLDLKLIVLVDLELTRWQECS